MSTMAFILMDDTNDVIGRTGSYWAGTRSCMPSPTRHGAPPSRRPRASARRCSLSRRPKPRASRPSTWRHRHRGRVGRPTTSCARPWSSTPRTTSRERRRRPRVTSRTQASGQRTRTRGPPPRDWHAGQPVLDRRLRRGAQPPHGRERHEMTDEDVGTDGAGLRTGAGPRGSEGRPSSGHSDGRRSHGRHSRPRVLPASYTAEHGIATVVHRLFTYVPQSTDIVFVGFVAGAAIATCLEACAACGDPWTARHTEWHYNTPPTWRRPAYQQTGTTSRTGCLRRGPATSRVHITEPTASRTRWWKMRKSLPESGLSADSPSIGFEFEHHV